MWILFMMVMMMMMIIIITIIVSYEILWNNIHSVVPFSDISTVLLLQNFPLSKHALNFVLCKKLPLITNRGLNSRDMFHTVL